MSETQRQAPEDRAGDADRRSLTAESAVTAVREMIEMMAVGGVKELDVRFGDVSIRLRGQDTHSFATTPSPVAEYEPLPPSADGPAAHAVSAPMIGTFYVAASPNDPPFVQMGDDVQAGQVIGIIEAMKIMNEIVADVGGRVTEVVASNGQAVEYGSPLIRLAPLESAAE